MLNRKTLDERTQEELQTILDKTLEELTEYDIGFIRARSIYLTEVELARYENVLNSESDIIKPVKTKSKK
jgi:hypothetical protein